MFVMTMNFKSNLSSDPFMEHHADNQSQQSIAATLSAGQDKNDALASLIDSFLGQESSSSVQLDQRQKQSNQKTTICLDCPEELLEDDDASTKLNELFEPRPIKERPSFLPTTNLQHPPPESETAQWSPLIHNFCNAQSESTIFWQAAVKKSAAGTVSEVPSKNTQQENNNTTSAKRRVVREEPSASRKPKPKPKRPLSAYNLFFRAERRKLLETLPDREAMGIGTTPRNSHGKLGFKDMARIISQKWRQATAHEKAPFDEMAKTDTLRYQREMSAWKICQANEEATVSMQWQRQQQP